MAYIATIDLREKPVGPGSRFDILDELQQVSKDVASLVVLETRRLGFRHFRREIDGDSDEELASTTGKLLCDPLERENGGSTRADFRQILIIVWLGRADKTLLKIRGFELITTQIRVEICCDFPAFR